MKIAQSGLMRRGVVHEPLRAYGLLLRGVVMVTYVLDDPDHPAQTETGDDGKDPVSVYCDVLIYSTKRGMHSHYLSKVPVSQDHSGIHNGRIWKPKATTLDVTGFPVDPNTGTFTTNLDGDHVLVGFLDDSLSMPIILGAVPHPNHDIGNLDYSEGHRLALKVADGDPDYWKHHGTFYGVSDQGAFVVDSTHANDGKIQGDGTEPVPQSSGDGSQVHNLPLEAEHRVEWFDVADPKAPQSKGYLSATKNSYELSLDTAKVFLQLMESFLDLQLGGGATLKVEGKDAAAKLALGNGAKSAMIAESWATFFDGIFKAWTIAHTHLTGVGPSAPPTEAPAFPPYSGSLATSTHLKFPDL